MIPPYHFWDHPADLVTEGPAQWLSPSLLAPKGLSISRGTSHYTSMWGMDHRKIHVWWIEILQSKPWWNTKVTSFFSYYRDRPVHIRSAPMWVVHLVVMVIVCYVFHTLFLCMQLLIILVLILEGRLYKLHEKRPPILVSSPITHLIFKSAPLQCSCKWSLLKIKWVIGFVDM